MVQTIKDNPTNVRSDQGRGTLRDLSEQAATAAQAAKDNLSNAASDAAAMLKEKGARIADGAQELASQARDEFQERIDVQKAAGADYAGRIADAMRRAGREFEEELPIAAKYIGVAAGTVDDYAEKFRGGNLNDLIDGTKSFARNQPTAFLGLTFLVGFGLVRFFKSSAEAAEPIGPTPAKTEPFPYH